MTEHRMHAVIVEAADQLEYAFSFQVQPQVHATARVGATDKKCRVFLLGTYLVGVQGRRPQTGHAGLHKRTKSTNSMRLMTGYYPSSDAHV
jgi:hypothetical protein